MSQRIDLRFGGYQEPESVHNRAAVRFGEALRRRLGDRVRFELIESVLKLGRLSGDLVPMVERGELTFCYMSTVRFSPAAPELEVLELPFVVKDRAAAFRVLDGAFGRKVAQRIDERTRCRHLGWWDNGFRHLTNRVRPIRSPADCRGLRIRTQMSALHGEVFGALGFVPLPTDVKEFCEQIGGDRFDAQDNPLTNIWHFGIHRFHRHITLTSHFWGASALVCNAEQYRNWPQDVRAAVDEAAREATACQRQYAAAEDADILERFDPAGNEIVTLDEAERAAFAAAVQPVVEKYRSRVDPEVIARLRA